jgi:hypothetical protein
MSPATRPAIVPDYPLDIFRFRMRPKREKLSVYLLARLLAVAIFPTLAAPVLISPSFGDPAVISSRRFVR